MRIDVTKEGAIKPLKIIRTYTPVISLPSEEVQRRFNFYDQTNFCIRLLRAIKCKVSQVWPDVTT